MKTINKMATALLLVGLWSCNDWLDIKPADRVSEERVFESEAGFHSALNGIYVELVKPELYGASMSCEMVEMLSQRYAVHKDHEEYRALVDFRYTEDYVKGRLSSVWDAVYRLVLNCNLILDNAEKHRELLSSTGYAVVRGEALALRAFLHFDMLRLFGPVYNQKPNALSIPYAESPTVVASALLPADSVLYDRILRDLDIAENLLQAEDPVVMEGPRMNEEEDNTYTYRSLRFNYYAVLALKARVYLWAGNKEKAREYALLLINDPNCEAYFPFTDYSEIIGNEKRADRIFSSEMLFGLYDTDRSDIYKNYFDEDNASSTLLTPPVGSIEKIFAGEEGDYRYSLWQESKRPGNKNRVCCRLKKSEENMAFDNYIPLIRLSEMYLIAAECAEEENEAYAYLNTLRRHRGLAQSVSEDFEMHLEHEYYKEFVCEGQLFFFYKRKNAPSLQSATTGAAIEMGYEAYVPDLPENETKYRN